jgi:hypothetical protein
MEFSEHPNQVAVDACVVVPNREGEDLRCYVGGEECVR